MNTPVTLPSALNPFPWYKRMRETSPVFFDDARKAWMIFRYADVVGILRDAETFSSAIPLPQDFPPLLTFTDPPQHDRLRRLVAPAFTPRAVSSLAPRITVIVDDLLSRILAQGGMDAVDDLAHPLPVTVMAELLGIPTQDRDQLLTWVDCVGDSPSASELSTPPGMTDYMRQVLRERRAYPKDDLISTLLQAQDGEGQCLDEWELVGLITTLLLAGSGSANDLISWVVFSLAVYPESMDRLRTDPALIPGAIEEVARYCTPFPVGARIAKKEVDIGGQHIHAEQMVLALLASANRDPAQFPDPEFFDITRSPNQHVAFSGGIHSCFGAPLGRLEAKIVLERMLEQMKDIHLKPEVLKALEPGRGSGFAYGLRHLPVLIS